MDTYEYLFKILVVGDWRVGKSAIVHRYGQDIFNQNGLVTVGIDFIKKSEMVDEKEVYLQVWEYSTSERYWRKEINYLIY